jgi:hypothetical protein
MSADGVSNGVLHKYNSMFPILLFLVFLCEFSESSQESKTNEVIFHEKILTSLNATELNVSTLNVLLSKLKLQNCTSAKSEGQVDCRHRVSVERYVIDMYDIRTHSIVNNTDMIPTARSHHCINYRTPLFRILLSFYIVVLYFFSRSVWMQRPYSTHTS